jgi:hypothetical protein
MKAVKRVIVGSFSSMLVRLGFGGRAQASIIPDIFDEERFKQKRKKSSPEGLLL